MGAHWIGKKKLKRFSNQIKLDLVRGRSVSGTKFYILECSNGDTITYNSKTKKYVEYKPVDISGGVEFSSWVLDLFSKEINEL